MKKFIIADTHFGHANIIKYCNRPFHNIDEMNNVLIKNWNNTVSKNDKVFVAGDFGFRRENIQSIAPALNGKKILIKGNHDTYPNDFYLECGFAEVINYPILVDYFLISHEPLVLSESTPYFNYYGHVHNDSRYQDTATSKCISVERINYKPIELGM